MNIHQKLGDKPNSPRKGEVLPVKIQQPILQTTIEAGFGLFVCPPGKSRRLSDFDVVQAMQDSTASPGHD